MLVTSRAKRRRPKRENQNEPIEHRSPENATWLKMRSVVKGGRRGSVRLERRILLLLPPSLSTSSLRSSTSLIIVAVAEPDQWLIIVQIMATSSFSSPVSRTSSFTLSANTDRHHFPVRDVRFLFLVLCGLGLDAHFGNSVPWLE